MKHILLYLVQILSSMKSVTLVVDCSISSIVLKKILLQYFFIVDWFYQLVKD